MVLALLIPIIGLGACIHEPPPPVEVECPNTDEEFADIGDDYLYDSEEAALLQLEALAEEPVFRCRAAFYLFFLDRKKRDHWAQILEEPLCMETAGLERAIVMQHKKTASYFSQCRKDRKWLRHQLKRCRSKLTDLKKENEKLNFEIKKLEEIHRETERLRLEK